MRFSRCRCRQADGFHKQFREAAGNSAGETMLGTSDIQVGAFNLVGWTTLSHISRASIPSRSSQVVALSYSSRSSFGLQLSVASTRLRCTRLNSGNANNKLGGTIKSKKPRHFINNLLSYLFYLQCGLIIPHATHRLPSPMLMDPGDHARR
jgi:hypothetical protein